MGTQLRNISPIDSNLSRRRTDSLPDLAKRAETLLPLYLKVTRERLRDEFLEVRRRFHDAKSLLATRDLVTSKAGSARRQQSESSLQGKVLCDSINVLTKLINPGEVGNAAAMLTPEHLTNVNEVVPWQDSQPGDSDAVSSSPRSAISINAKIKNMKILVKPTRIDEQIVVHHREFLNVINYYNCMIIDACRAINSLFLRSSSDDPSIAVLYPCRHVPQCTKFQSRICLSQVHILSRDQTRLKHSLSATLLARILYAKKQLRLCQKHKLAEMPSRIKCNAEMLHLMGYVDRTGDSMYAMDSDDVAESLSQLQFALPLRNFVPLSTDNVRDEEEDEEEKEEEEEEMDNDSDDDEDDDSDESEHEDDCD